MSTMREGLQGAANSPTPLEDPQLGVPRAMLRLPEGLQDKVAAEAAPDGPRWRETLPMPRVLIHMQD